MRHSDYRTALTHYTDLDVRDAAAALNTLPVHSAVAQDHQHHQKTTSSWSTISCQMVQNGATGPPGQNNLTASTTAMKTRVYAPPPSDLVQGGCEKAGDRTRTGNIQLGRLTLYH